MLPRKKKPEKHLRLSFREQDPPASILPLLKLFRRTPEMESLRLGRLIRVTKVSQPQEELLLPWLDITLSQYGNVTCLERLLSALGTLAPWIAKLTMDCWPWASNTSRLFQTSHHPLECGSSWTSPHPNSTHSALPLTELDLSTGPALYPHQWQPLLGEGLNQATKLTKLSMRLRLDDDVTITSSRQEQEPKEEPALTTPICPHSPLKQVSLSFYGGKGSHHNPHSESSSSSSSNSTMCFLTRLLLEQPHMETLQLQVSNGPLLVNEFHHHDHNIRPITNATTSQQDAFVAALQNHQSLHTLTLMNAIDDWQDTTAWSWILQALPQNTSLTTLDLSLTNRVTARTVASSCGPPHPSSSASSSCILPRELWDAIPQLPSQLRHLLLPPPESAVSPVEAEALGQALQTNGAIVRLEKQQHHDSTTTRPWHDHPSIGPNLVRNWHLALSTPSGGSSPLWPHLLFTQQHSPTLMWEFLRTNSEIVASTYQHPD